MTLIKTGCLFVREICELCARTLINDVKHNYLTTKLGLIPMVLDTAKQKESITMGTLLS